MGAYHFMAGVEIRDAVERVLTRLQFDVGKGAFHCAPDLIHLSINREVPSGAGGPIFRWPRANKSCLIALP